jgi:hypothetical protein
VYAAAGDFETGLKQLVVRAFAPCCALTRRQESAKAPAADRHQALLWALVDALWGGPAPQDGRRGGGGGFPSAEGRALGRQADTDQAAGEKVDAWVRAATGGLAWGEGADSHAPVSWTDGRAAGRRDAVQQGGAGGGLALRDGRGAGAGHGRGGQGLVAAAARHVAGPRLFRLLSGDASAHQAEQTKWLSALALQFWYWWVAAAAAAVSRAFSPRTARTPWRHFAASWKGALPPPPPRVHRGLTLAGPRALQLPRRGGERPGPDPALALPRAAL